MPQPSSTPAGFHSATPYLIFDGTAADAIAFYRDVFAATELPGRLTDPAGRILNATILIGDSVIRVGDEAPWRIAKSPRTLGGASSFVHLYVTDADAVIERAVALGAKILLPIQGPILRRPLRKHRRSIRAGLDYRHGTIAENCLSRDEMPARQTPGSLLFRLSSQHSQAPRACVLIRRRHLHPSSPKMPSSRWSDGALA